MGSFCSALCAVTFSLALLLNPIQGESHKTEWCPMLPSARAHRLCKIFGLTLMVACVDSWKYVCSPSYCTHSWRVFLHRTQWCDQQSPLLICGRKPPPMESRPCEREQHWTAHRHQGLRNQRRYPEVYYRRLCKHWTVPLCGCTGRECGFWRVCHPDGKWVYHRYRLSVLEHTDMSRDGRFTEWCIMQMEVSLCGQDFRLWA